MSRIKVGIIGATGYTGSELVRILTNHPQVEITCITSESHTGKTFDEIHPAFRRICETKLIAAEEAYELDLDIVFLALPHGVSMQYASRFDLDKTKVIDLSADFRFNDLKLYERWYRKHKSGELMQRSVYGMPEIFREAIKNASLIGNPGCFPTATLLAMLPVLREGWVDPNEVVIADAKSGTTGAGVKPSAVTHYSTQFGNFFPYKTGHHRHQPEISHIAERGFNTQSKVIFTPHLLPTDRGILSSVYLKLNHGSSQKQLQQLYHDFYKNEPFVRVLKAEPKIKEVRGSNYADVFPFYHQETGYMQAACAIDNLVKGASGAAVQNMNLMLGFEETAGLHINPLMP